MTTTRATAKGKGTPATTSAPFPAANPGSPTSTFIDSAAKLPMATLAIRAASGPGARRSRGQGPPSPIAAAPSLPPHMQHLASVWADMSVDMKHKVAKIPHTTVEAGLRETEMDANRNATELATREHRHRRQGLVQVAHGLDASIAELEASAAAKNAEARALKPKAPTAHAATAAEDTAHSKHMARFNSRPRASNSNRMDPPSPRQRVTAAVAFATQPPSADSWAAVTSRSHPAPPHTSARPLIDDAYLEIRVSSFRFHNEHFPEDIKNQIFDLSTTVYTALSTMHHAKAPLRFARDLASKECSPLRPEIVDGIFTLCDVVRWAYNSGADRHWFDTTIRNSQATATRKPHTQADSSASDSSVEVLRQRPRDEPSSGRGKPKRVMTALTSDSDSSSETTRRNDRDLRYLRQVPRFYHAPDPNDGSDPPFPPRIARTSTVHWPAPPRSLPTHTPALETHASCPPTTLNEDFSPPTTHQLVDTITSAALAAVNEYLANIGLLPQTTPDSQPPAPSLARIMPDPPVLVETSAPAPVPRSTLYVENDTRYLQDSRPPHPLSMPPPSGFDNVFTTKCKRSTAR